VIATVKAALALPFVLVMTLPVCVVMSILMWPCNVATVFYAIAVSKNIGCQLKLLCLIFAIIPAALYLVIVPVGCVFYTLGLSFAAP
jgi:hypothetical protein